jgi:hypothetical protein
MISRHLTTSEAMKRPNSSGVVVTGSAPNSAKRARTAGSAIAVRTSLFSLSMIGRGVPRGTTKPNQAEDS